MYARLTAAVVDEPFILDMLEHVPSGQLHMNLLFGAVQYLLLADRHHPLAEWYPSLGGTRSGPGLEDEFVGYVAEHAESITQLVSTRRVQTNEINRCAFLLPAYNAVSVMTGRPIALIEIGTSAGLTQNLDRYHYTYTSDAEEVTVGGTSLVELACHTGATVPRAARNLPQLASRVGFDLHPIDVADPDQARWLRALVWPDSPERHARLGAAITVAAAHPPALIAGDAATALPELVMSAPSDAAIVVQHSFVLNQFSEADRVSLYGLLDTLAMDRAIYRVGAEWLVHERGTVLELTVHGRGAPSSELAKVHHHGMWLDWSGSR